MKEYKSRHLTKAVFDELKDGILHPLLVWVKRDDTLNMEFRRDYVSVYYRGGELLTADKNGITFNRNYLSKAEKEKEFSTNDLELMAYYKQNLDFWFCDKKQSYEREFEQLICRVNNADRPGNLTDYFVLDMEFSYEYEENKSVKPDLVAIQIPAQGGVERRGAKIENSPHKLAFIEVKYGDSAISSKGNDGDNPGVYNHFKDYKDVLCDKELMQKISQDMKKVFEQKIELGLLPGIHGNPTTIHIWEEKADYIYVLANHTPWEGCLKEELEHIINEYAEKDLENVYIATASEMGYGLLSERCVSLVNYYNEIVCNMERGGVVE